MKSKLKQDIGLRLRKIRKILGLKQYEFVSSFNIGRANYSKIESGEVFPNIYILFILKKKFNVSLDWLITGEGEMFLHKKKESKAVEIPEELCELFELIQEIPEIKQIILAELVKAKELFWRKIQDKCTSKKSNSENTQKKNN